MVSILIKALAIFGCGQTKEEEGADATSSARHFSSISEDTSESSVASFPVSHSSLFSITIFIIQE